MAWWIWVLGGLVLLVAEVTTPGGFFAIFFGAGAILVGGLKALGWDGPAWAEWLVFTVLSVASLAFFRKPLMRRFSLSGGKKTVDRMEGERALVTEDVAPGGVGKAEMRGATWTARTAGDVTLAKGCRCRVERVEGLTLWLRAE
jgi:inner membrane protein